MRSNSTIFLGLVSFLCISFRVGVGAEDDIEISRLTQATQREVDRFRVKRGLDGPVAASLSFFSGQDRAELLQLSSCGQPDISIRAAWELARRDQVNSAALSLFVNAVKETLKIDLPSWWIKANLTAVRVSDLPSEPGDTSSRLKLTLDTHCYPKYRKQFEGWFLQAGQEMRVGDNGLCLHEAKHSIKVPAEIINCRKQVGFRRCIVALLSEQSVFLVLHGGVDANFPIFRFERSTNQCTWMAIVAAGATPVSRFGVEPPEDRKGGDCAITMLQDTGKLWVFGADGYQAFVEGFDESDGASIVRFSTSY